MSATFAATFSAVALSAAQDVFEIVAPSNSRAAIRIDELEELLRLMRADWDTAMDKLADLHARITKVLGD